MQQDPNGKVNVDDISFELKITDKPIVDPKKPEKNPRETGGRPPNYGGTQRSKCSKLCQKPYMFIWIGAIALVVLIAVVIIVVLILKKPSNDNKEEITIPGTQDEIIIEPPKIKNEFNILTRAGDLKQISVIQKSKEETKLNDQVITSEITRKTDYDIYFISQEQATEEYQEYYSKMTSGVVSIRGECTASNGGDCIPQPLLELTKDPDNSQRNVRVLEDLKDIPLPICFFNITDNHIITTLKCPESLSDIKRNEIILDLYFFRPPAAERADKENDNITLTINKDNVTEKTTIHETNGGLCNVYNNWGTQCTTDMKTVLDKNGNVISYDEEAITIINYDEKNSYVKDKTTQLVDTSEKVQNKDIQNYKVALDTLLPLMENYMKEEVQFTQSDFKDLLSVIEDKKKSAGDQSYMPKKTRNTFRNLVTSKEQYIKKSSLFSNKATPIEVNLDLKINSGIHSSVSGVYGSIIFDNKEIKYTSIEEASMLEDLIDKLSRLSKTGNQLASELYDKVYDKLEEATNEISIQITSLEKLIKYYELLPVFNATLVKYSYNVLPSEIIHVSNDLLNKISNIFFNLKSGTVKENADVLYSNINNYIDKLHELIREMLNSLGTLSNILVTKNNTYTEITNYYLNNTSSSYTSIIQKMKTILANYYIREFAYVYPRIYEIINLFNQNTNETLKDEINYIKDLYDKLQKKIYTITSISESEYQTVLSNLENSIQYYYSIVQDIKDYLIEIMNIKPNGYFISDEDITAFRNTFTNILSEADEVAKKLNNVNIIDKVFDEIMIKFRENYIFTVKYMEQIKSGNFTLEEDVLNNTLFTEKIKIQLENDLKQLSEEIIDKIKQENNFYMGKIQNYFDVFFENNLDNLNELLSDIDVLFSEEGLQAIAHSFELSINLFSEKITEIINENNKLIKEYFDSYYNLINNNNALREITKNHKINFTYIYDPFYKEYETHQMTGYDSITGKMRTLAYLTKYNSFMANLNYSEEYLKEILYYDLMNEYKEIFIQIKDELLSILNNDLSIQFPDFENIQFLEKHMRVVEKLKFRLEKYFSTDNFNNKFSKVIEETIEANVNSIKATKDYIKNKHNSFNETRYYEDDSNDICVLFKRKVCYGCTNCVHYTFFIDRYCFTLPLYQYNYIKMKKLEYESLIDFGDLSISLNGFEVKIKEKIDTYKEIMNSFNINLTSIKEQTLNEKITTNYLKELQDWIQVTMSQKLGNNLLNYSYNYYQQNIERKIGNMLEDISNRWKNTFNTLKEDVKNNIDNLKYSMFEFTSITLATKTILQVDFTENYLNSIIYFQQSELNYTISYYYNYIYKIINKAYKYLINNIPQNDNNLNEITSERKKEIKNYFDNIFKDLSNSEVYYLSLNNQLNILKINEIDFFKVRSILLQSVKETDEVIDNTMDAIADIEKYSNPGEDYTVVMRFYLENKEFGKLIEEYFEPIDNGEFFYLEIDKFKDVMYDNWIFDSDDFINIINTALHKTNKEIKKELLIKLEEYTYFIEEEIKKNFNDDIANIINDLYQKQIKDLTPSQNNTINQNVKELLNELETIIKSEAERIKSIPGVYNFNYENIKSYLMYLKNATLTKIANSIFEVLDNLYENIYENVYTNCINDNLNNYLTKAKLVTDNIDISEYNLLNSSYKIGDIIFNLSKEIIENYKVMVAKKIDSKYFEYYQKIKEAINLEKISKDVNTFFDNAYQNIMLPQMTTSNNCISPSCPSFKFTDENINLINNKITEKINSIKNVMELTKGDNYLSSFQCNLDFTNSGNNIIKPICDSFQDFLSFEKGEQLSRINTFIQNFINSNLDDFLSNIVPTFGNQFFERIIDYNINFKVIVLYQNLHYAFGQTLGYYHSLNFFTDCDDLPSDLKIRLLQLNDLDVTILNKEQDIKALLEQKLNSLILDLKDTSKQAYTRFLKENADIKNSFSSSILEKIDFNLEAIMPKIEKTYKKVLDRFLKDKFMIAFSELLNETSQKMIDDFNEEKKNLDETLTDLFSSEEDKDLNAVNKYIKITLDTIQNYRNFFYTFNISQSAKDFFINYGNNVLLGIFQHFNKDLNKKLKDAITTTINNNSLLIEQLDYEEFTDKAKYIHDYIFDKYLNILLQNFKDYGLNQKDYKDNLMKALEENSGNRRRLVDTESQIELEAKKGIESRYVKDTLYLITNKARNAYNYNYRLNAYSDYKKNIKKYNTTLNTDFKQILEMINNNKYNEEIDLFMKEKLDNLYNIMSEYYNEVYSSFSNLERSFNLAFSEFDINMYDVVVSTYFVMNNQYIEILRQKNNMSKTVSNFTEEYPSDLQYNLKSENLWNNATIKIKNLKEYGEFEFNSTLEGIGFLVPKIKSRIVNKIIPKNIELEIKTGYSFCNNRGYLFDIEFNDANLTMTIEYDAKSNYINMTTYNNIEKYNYSMHYYEMFGEAVTEEISVLNYAWNVTKCINGGKRNVSRNYFKIDEKDEVEPTIINK